MDLEPEIYSTSITARLSGLLARDTLKISEKRGIIYRIITKRYRILKEEQSL